MAAALAKTQLQFPPGSKAQYSNAAPYVLARIIEVRSGKPFHEHVQQTILGPAGMRDSYFIIPSAEAKRTAIVYRDTKERTMMSPALRRIGRKAWYGYLPWQVRRWARRRFRTRPPTVAEIFTPDSYNRLHRLLRDDVARLQEYLQRELPWDFPRSKYE